MHDLAMVKPKTNTPTSMNKPATRYKKSDFSDSKN